MYYPIFSIAIYLRLSKEEPAREESNSIKNQRNLLLQFIQNQKEWTNYKILEFADDGYSGIHFNRPAVQQLLEQVKAGKIDCIIVKDLSRFSRDYIELGTYIEQIFPFLGVRFISLNDNYDSAKKCGAEMDFVSAFQTFFYDWYSKDLSEKVKMSLKIKKEKGQYLSPYPPYGYQKDSVNKHAIKINQEESEVVQKIFSLALQEKTLYEIAQFLNHKKIPTRTQTALWNPSTISQILKNSFYIGDMYYDKYKTEKTTKKSSLKAKEEWKQIQNHHIPIIKSEVFEEVQEIMKRKKERRNSKQKQKTKSIYLFAGKLYCGACQRKLQIRKTKHPYFICTTRYITETDYCVKRLEIDIIIQIIKQYLSTMLTIYQLQEKIQTIQNQIVEQKEKELQKKLRQVEKEQEQIHRKKTIKYQDYIYKKMEKEVYSQWNNKIKIKEENLEKLQIQYKKKEIFLKKQKEEQEWLSSLKLQELLIKKIFVFDQQKLLLNWNFSLLGNSTDKQ